MNSTRFHARKNSNNQLNFQWLESGALRAHTGQFIWAIKFAEGGDSNDLQSTRSNYSFNPSSLLQNVSDSTAPTQVQYYSIINQLYITTTTNGSTNWHTRRVPWRGELDSMQSGTENKIFKLLSHLHDSYQKWFLHRIALIPPLPSRLAGPAPDSSLTPKLNSQITPSSHHLISSRPIRFRFRFHLKP